jgi:putative FmdB family regulatory protein
MPIYAYRCTTCGHAQDHLQRISDPLLDTCPACGAATYVKQVTAAGFQLKGSGWYVTDFRNNGSGAAKPADKDGEGAAAAADKGADAAPGTADKAADKATGPAAEKPATAPPAERATVGWSAKSCSTRPSP